MAAGVNFWVFTPLQYSYQVVAGTKYQIIYGVGGKSTLTVSVYEPLDGEIQVEILEKNFREDSALSLSSSVLGVTAILIAMNYWRWFLNLVIF